MIAIIDLDYTLFDSKKFRHDLSGVFGLSVDEFNHDYQKFFKNKKINFSINLYLEILKAEKKITREEVIKIKNNYKVFITKADNYFFDGAKEVLLELKRAGIKMILATFGDPKWQKEKVEHLSIKSIFSQVYYEDRDKSKSELFRELKKKKEKILIINDNYREYLAIKKVLGDKCVPFLVAGPYSQENIPEKVYKNIGDFLLYKKEIISNLS